MLQEACPDTTRVANLEVARGESRSARQLSVLRLMAIVGLVAVALGYLRMASKRIPEPVEWIVLATACSLAFGSYSCSIAVRKHRPWWEGYLIGSLWGPLGLFVEWILPDRRLDPRRCLWERVVLRCLYGPFVHPVVKLFLDRRRVQTETNATASALERGSSVIPSVPDPVACPLEITGAASRHAGECANDETTPCAPSLALRASVPPAGRARP
jgi:hypothetical protein